MNQIKIGEFIQDRRKTQGLKQRELAEKLDISDKTVSKWETGNGMPDVSLMIPLCEILDINVNELLSGEKLNSENFKEMANKNIMDILKEKKEAKRKIAIEILVCFAMFVAVISMICIAAYVPMPTWVSILLIALSLLILIVSIVAMIMLEISYGVYECPHCHEQFVPTTKEFVMSMHTITKRHLKCPNCGERHWCKRHLTKKEEN